MDDGFWGGEFFGVEFGPCGEEANVFGEEL